jgi:hypothetical protein
MMMMMMMMMMIMMISSLTYLGPKISSNKNLAQPEFILVAIYA